MGIGREGRREMRGEEERERAKLLPIKNVLKMFCLYLLLKFRKQRVQSLCLRYFIQK